MRVSRLAFFGLGVVTVAVAAVPIAKHVANLPGKIDVDGSMRLPNGERIHAVGRSKISLHGDMPLAFFPSASGAYCYVVTGGHHDHGISLINLRGDVDEFYIPQTKCTGGIIESSDGTGLFAAGDLGIRRFVADASKDGWAPAEFKVPDHAWIQGLVTMPGELLLATDINNDLLLCFDRKTHDKVWTLKVGHKPNRIAVDQVGKRIAVTNWGALASLWSTSMAHWIGKSRLEFIRAKSLPGKTEHSSFRTPVQTLFR